MRSNIAFALLVSGTVVCFSAFMSAQQVDATATHQMTVWSCLTWVAVAGAIGGLVNTLMADGKFRLPRYEAGILCPGFIGNALIGGFASVISWSLYGAGAGVELARRAAASADDRQVVSLTVGALAGAALVGVGGARWLSNEVDTKLLRASVSVTAEKVMSAEQRSMIASAPAVDVLRAVRSASSPTP